MAVDDKPARASGYDANRTALILRACLEVATRLDDFRDDLCVVGGLVPSLLVESATSPRGVEAHVGTYDLDLGLAVAVLDEKRYEEIAQRLREAGFVQDRNEAGNATAQRWRSREGALIDFLIPPTSKADKAGRLRNLDKGFAAIITPGLHLAFQDREMVLLEGETLTGGSVARTIPVCGPGAFIVLKALAFRNRGTEKDAYDLWYVIQNREDSARRLKTIAEDPDAKVALKILEEDFTDAARIGPRRVAEFRFGRRDDNAQADVAGQVRALLAVALE